MDNGWNTDAGEFAKAIQLFEAALPGFWWSVGQCSVGAHASCAVDGNGSQSDLLDGVKAGQPFDSGFHCDTSGGSPAEALRDVMEQAMAHMNEEVACHCVGQFGPDPDCSRCGGDGSVGQVVAKSEQASEEHD